ncbi:MAG: hypothetical protein WC055_00900 [Melioribacteraceae bacterium]
MNYHKFEEKLLELLIFTEYEKENPINVNTCTAESINIIPHKAKEYYLHNVNFHARINYLVSNIVKLAKGLEKDCGGCERLSQDTENDHKNYCMSDDNAYSIGSVSDTLVKPNWCPKIMDK